MESRAIWTFADAVEYLIDSSGSTNQTEERRKARLAVQDAYRDFALQDDWAYLTRRGQFIADAEQTSSTITYDHTGGTYEREVTLASGTWPTNARYGTLIIAGQHYLIEDRKSSTVVTLRHDSNPGADVAAGTSYTYYRAIYPVPLDFRRGSDILDFDQSGRHIPYIAPDKWLQLLSVNDSPQDWVNAYTIRGVTDDYNTLAFELTPPPSAAATFDYTYHATPLPLQTFGTAPEYSTGTISVSSTTVTGSGTTFASNMVGCVIRFPPSGTSTVPTGNNGAYGNDNPAFEYRIVTAVSNTTTLTIDQTVDGTYSGAKYTIGSPLDFDYHVMLDAFLAMARWKFAILLQKSATDVEHAHNNWIRAFRIARGNDNRRPTNQSPFPMPRYWQVYTGEPM